ncbi:MAG: DUF4173 domain-containing protein [Devosia sp.]
MTDTTEPLRASEPPIWTTRTFIAGATLALLVFLGDVLFWYHSPGVSVLVFFIALIAAILALHPAKLGETRTVVLMLVALLGALPFFETLSPWAFLTAQGGVTLLAIGISGNLPKFEDWAGAFTRFGILTPLRLVGDAFRLLIEGGQQRIGGKLLRTAMVWLVPLAFAAIFVWLFAAANPVVEYALRAIRLDKLLEFLEPPRIILWGLIAIFAWPFLAPRLLNWTPLPQMQGPVLPRAESILFGSRAIFNSLALFNALFAVQTVLDLIYLWGGVRLPDGVSHAEYAHRGAYPLIVTAILAGAFVLAAMRKNGPGRASPLIRNLVYLWIAQNVWLVISSVLRLKLYVEIYTLSEMRIAAFIWMGLVAVGLILIVIKIALDRSNKWLVMSNMAALSVTLWAVSWIDLQSFIAFYNVRHSREVAGEGVALDQYYTYELGPAAIPALDEFLAKGNFSADPSVETTFSLIREELADRIIYRRDGDIHRFALDWRGWTWRNDRLEQYLIDHPFAPDIARAID